MVKYIFHIGSSVTLETYKHFTQLILQSFKHISAGGSNSELLYFSLTLINTPKGKQLNGWRRMNHSSSTLNERLFFALLFVKFTAIWSLQEKVNVSVCFKVNLEVI